MEGFVLKIRLFVYFLFVTKTVKLEGVCRLTRRGEGGALARRRYAHV